jgi:hypothetical protein
MQLNCFTATALKYVSDPLLRMTNRSGCMRHVTVVRVQQLYQSVYFSLQCRWQDVTGEASAFALCFTNPQIGSQGFSANCFHGPDAQ